LRRPPVAISDFAQAQHLAQVDLAGDVGAGFLAHERVEAGRKLPLARLGVVGQKRLGHHEAQHAVAQKFQTLVVGARGRGQRRMRQRAAQEVGIPKLVPQPLGERGKFPRKVPWA
jgi:hypothetical protein